MTHKSLSGITANIKDRLVQQALERRLRRIEQPDIRPGPVQHEPEKSENIPEKFYRFHLHPGYQQLRIIDDGAARLGVPNPYFKVHEGIAGVTTRIEGREYLNFASYNYLGLSGDARVSAAAKASIDRFGTWSPASVPFIVIWNARLHTPTA
jgi:8-amino-7-oxononanoate synthase